MADRAELINLLNQRVTVTNPDPAADTSWTGELISLIPEPSMILELPDGQLFPLPQSFDVRGEAS